MPRGFIRKRSNFTKDTLLKVAALGVITIATAASPYFLHHVVVEYFHDRNKKAAQARARKLRELKRRKLLSFKELGNGSVKIELSHHGKRLVRMYNLEDMKIQKPKRWDGWWRMITYDIPTRQKQASNAFREKIKALGLYPMQRSIWISPYECLPEIEFLAMVFEINIDNCICYLKLKTVPNEERVKRFFEIT